MRRLHARHDAGRDEELQRGIRHRLDVLDAVGRAAMGEPGDGAHHELDARVADGVRRGRDPSAVELGERFAVLLRIEPERLRRLPEAVGLVQPGRAVVDRAVDHELHAPDDPTAPVQPLQSCEPVDLLDGGAGLEPGRHPKPDRQVARLLDGPQELDGVGRQVLHLPGREAGAGHPHEDLGEAVDALVEGELRNERLDQRHRLQLEQVPGGPARRVGDDPRTVREPLVAAASGDLEGPGRRQRCVRIEQADERRTTGGDVVEHAIGDLATLERAGVEAPPEEPVPVAEGLELRAQAILHLGEGAAAGEVGATRERQPEHRVDVAVDEPGEDGRTGQLVDRRAVADEALEVGAVADGHHPSVRDGDPVGALQGEQPVGHRDDPAAEEDGLGDEVRAHRSSASWPPISANRSGRVERSTIAYTIPPTRTSGTTVRMIALTTGPAAVR